MPVEIQSDGRERLVFIEGDVAVPPFAPWAQTDEALSSIAALVRAFHEASSRVRVVDAKWSDELADPFGGTMICHNDVCLENVVFRDGNATALLDSTSPHRGGRSSTSPPSLMCVPIDDDLSASRLGFMDLDRPSRLRLVADAYGLDSERAMACSNISIGPWKMVGRLSSGGLKQAIPTSFGCSRRWVGCIATSVGWSGGGHRGGHLCGR